MRTCFVAAGVALCVSGGLVQPAFGQAPPADMQIWKVLASAGLALTSGNSDTSTINAAFDITYDPKTNNVVKSDGLWIRGETEGDLTASRLGLNLRDERSLTPRIFVFGQNQYLRDEFKQIDYLIAPTGGLGYRFFNTEQTKLSVDGAVGGVWEKNPDVDLRGSGALGLGERLTQTLTSTTVLTQTFSGLWKTRDLEDALFTFGLGVAASMSTRTQLKVELLDTFKNEPPRPDLEKNDVAVLVAIVYKM